LYPAAERQVVIALIFLPRKSSASSHRIGGDGSRTRRPRQHQRGGSRGMATPPAVARLCGGTAGAVICPSGKECTGDHFLGDLGPYPDRAGLALTRDGSTPSFSTTPRPMRLRQMGATLSAGTRAIRRWRQKITFSLRTQRGERGQVVITARCRRPLQALGETPRHERLGPLSGTKRTSNAQA
jgi:hypothetical protein